MSNITDILSTVTSSDTSDTPAVVNPPAPAASSTSIDATPTSRHTTLPTKITPSYVETTSIISSTHIQITSITSKETTPIYSVVATPISSVSPTDDSTLATEDQPEEQEQSSGSGSDMNVGGATEPIDTESIDTDTSDTGTTDTNSTDIGTTDIEPTDDDSSGDIFSDNSVGDKHFISPQMSPADALQSKPHLSFVQPATPPLASGGVIGWEN